MLADNSITSSSINLLLKDYTFGRYIEDASINTIKAREYLADSIISFTNNENYTFLPFTINDRLKGVLIFHLSEWDTIHFGFNYIIVDYCIVVSSSYHERYVIACELLKSFHEYCLKNQITFLVSKISALDLPVIHALEAQGFNFIETWIYNQYSLKNLSHQKDNGILIRTAGIEDLNIMLSFSKEAFKSQRFHADSNFITEKAETLYNNWIYSAFKDSNQIILAGEYNGLLLGYMVYYLNDLSSIFGLKYAQWKMALMNPELRGKGMGSKFFIALFHYHKEEGIDVIESGLSARNLVSLNLHNKLDFKVFSTLITFHKWMKNSI